MSLGGAVLLTASFPRTVSRLRQDGFDARTVDISELQRAECGVTCMSLLVDG